MGIPPAKYILFGLDCHASFGRMKSKSAIWQRHIERQAKSGKSLKAYCIANRISPATFQYWKRKLRSASDPVTFEEVQRPVQVDRYRAIHIRFPTGVEMWLEKIKAPACV